MAPPEAVHAGAGLNGSERNERFQLAGHWHSEGGAGEGSQNQPRGRGEGSEGRWRVELLAPSGWRRAPSVAAVAEGLSFGAAAGSSFAKRRAQRLEARGTCLPRWRA